MTRIETTPIPNPFILFPSFRAAIVDPTWVPCDPLDDWGSVGSLSKSTKSKPPGKKAEVESAVESAKGPPPSRTATATSLVPWPIAVSAVSRPICWRFHWRFHRGSLVKFVSLAFRSSSRLSLGWSSL